MPFDREGYEDALEKVLEKAKQPTPAPTELPQIEGLIDAFKVCVEESLDADRETTGKRYEETDAAQAAARTALREAYQKLTEERNAIDKVGGDFANRAFAAEDQVAALRSEVERLKRENEK